MKSKIKKPQPGRLRLGHEREAVVLFQPRRRKQVNCNTPSPVVVKIQHCCFSTTRRRPRRESLCVWNTRPLRQYSGSTARSGCPFTHKPGALKAGEADSRNGKPNLPTRLVHARIPDKTFITSGLACPTTRLPRKGRAIGSACAMGEIQ